MATPTNNDAQLREDGGQWSIEGDPTEGALLVLGAKAGLPQETCARDWPRLDSIPFESQHRFMASSHQDAEGRPWILVKGAPERILEMCSTQLTDAGAAPLDPDYWRRMATDTAARGLRLAPSASGAPTTEEPAAPPAEVEDGDDDTPPPPPSSPRPALKRIK